MHELMMNCSRALIARPLLQFTSNDRPGNYFYVVSHFILGWKSIRWLQFVINEASGDVAYLDSAEDLSAFSVSLSHEAFNGPETELE